MLDGPAAKAAKQFSALAKMYFEGFRLQDGVWTRRDPQDQVLVASCGILHPLCAPPPPRTLQVRHSDIMCLLAIFILCGAHGT